MVTIPMRNTIFIYFYHVMFLFLTVLSVDALSAEITAIDPYKLIDRVKKSSHEKPIVVHFTSSDKKCGHCQTNNTRMLKAGESLNDSFDFLEIDFTPWRSYWKKKDLIEIYRKNQINITGLPATRVFYKGHVISGIDGNISNLIDEINQTKDVIHIFDHPESVKGKSIPTVNSDKLANYIQSNSKKPLLIHFTSTDGSSPHATRGNAYMKNAYNNLQADFNFVEVIFNPWTEIKNKKTLRGKYKIKGLPHLVIYHNNKPVNYQGGVIPSLEEGLVKYAEYLKK